MNPVSVLLLKKEEVKKKVTPQNGVQENSVREFM
jgi:hypothetical protein